MKGDSLSSSLTSAKYIVSKVADKREPVRLYGAKLTDVS